MEKNKIYQILIKGKYKTFHSDGKYHSQKVYREEPTQKDINKFIDACCNSEHPNDLMDLDEDTVTVKILELELCDPTT